MVYAAFSFCIELCESIYYLSIFHIWPYSELHLADIMVTQRPGCGQCLLTKNWLSTSQDNITEGICAGKAFLLQIQHYLCITLKQGGKYDSLLFLIRDPKVIWGLITSSCPFFRYCVNEEVNSLCWSICDATVQNIVRIFSQLGIWWSSKICLSNSFVIVIKLWIEHLFTNPVSALKYLP